MKAKTGDQNPNPEIHTPDPQSAGAGQRLPMKARLQEMFVLANHGNDPDRLRALLAELKADSEAIDEIRHDLLGQLDFEEIVYRVELREEHMKFLEAEGSRPDLTLREQLWLANWLEEELYRVRKQLFGAKRRREHKARTRPSGLHP
jgi:hypothetical protein